MIVCGDSPLAVGEIKITHVHISGDWTRVGIKVLREATREEYVKYCEEEGKIAEIKRLNRFHYGVEVLD